LATGDPQPRTRQRRTRRQDNREPAEAHEGFKEEGCLMRSPRVSRAERRVLSRNLNHLSARPIVKKLERAGFKWCRAHRKPEPIASFDLCDHRGHLASSCRQAKTRRALNVRRARRRAARGAHGL
jgi:hypothetical protein